MVHLPPLPGSPGIEGDRSAIRKRLHRDASALEAGSVNGIMLETFGDTPFYPDRVPRHVVADITALAETLRECVSVPFDDEDLEHAFSHGVRMALQYIGGVGVRAVTESLGEDGTYVFDNETGGSGVTVLLTLGSGDTHEKFDTAIDLIEEAFECDCDTGCPFCIYQYGCENQNDPETIAKDDLMDLIDAGLTLSQRDIEANDVE